MVQVITKFNVGDRVTTFDNKTRKAIDFTVGCIGVHIGKDYKSVTYYPVDESGRTCYEDSHEEDLCFATKEELLDYVAR